MNQSRRSKKLGKCKICLQQVDDLKRGHVFPEWSSKISGLMAATGISYQVNAPRVIKEKVSPLTEYFFCGKCEEKLGVGEDEIRRTFLSPNSEKSKTSASLEISDFPCFFYKTSKKHLIERAILGILFKAHLTNDPHYAGIYLSKTLFRKIQKALQEDTRLENFEVSAHKFFNFTEDAYYHYDFSKVTMITNPLALQAMYKIENEFYIALAGITFHVTFPPPKGGYVEDEILCTVGDIKYTQHITENTYMPTVSTHPRLLKEWREDILRYSLDSPCPCGLSWTNNGKVLERRTFGECCQPLWFDNFEYRQMINQYDIWEIYGDENFTIYLENPPEIMAVNPPDFFHQYNIDLNKFDSGELCVMELVKYHYQEYKYDLSDIEFKSYLRV